MVRDEEGVRFSDLDCYDVVIGTMEVALLLHHETETATVTVTGYESDIDIEPGYGWIFHGTEDLTAQNVEDFEYCHLRS